MNLPTSLDHRMQQIDHEHQLGPAQRLDLLRAQLRHGSRAVAALVTVARRQRLSRAL